MLKNKCYKSVTAYCLAYNNLRNLGKIYVANKWLMSVKMFAYIKQTN
jgi:hypothetical protein